MRSRLLRLPAELRLLVYKALIRRQGYRNVDMLTSLRHSCRLLKAELDPRIIAAARKHFNDALTAPPRINVRLPMTFGQALVLQITLYLCDLGSSLGTLPWRP
jgi:hypothetical protein